jgi:hypothetical protein
MQFKAPSLAAVAVLVMAASPALAAQGGKSAEHASDHATEHASSGHGAATSAAATSKETQGVAKALSVVNTNSASENAKAKLQLVLDKLLGRSSSEEEEAPAE